LAYTDSSGKTHVSLSEASKGRAAQTTASRNAAGEIVGSSSGSNYARAQEEQQEQARAAAEQNSVRNSIQYNTDTPAWATAPGETANIDRSQLQKFRTVEQLEAEKNKGTISRTLSAFKQGYKAGEGKEYSLEGLKAPVNRAQDMATYSLYNKATALTEKYNSLQNSALSRVPSGLGKDILTGLSNVPEMAIGAVGAVPLGLESIARNPSSVTDSISFGLGAMAGATVEKAETHPGELAGELVGGYALGKGAGALKSKLKPVKLQESTLITSERQFQVLEGVESTKIETLGTPREYLKIKTRVAGEGELNPLDIETAQDLLSKDSRTFEVKYTKSISLTDSDLNTGVTAGEGIGKVTLKRPNIIQAEQKTLSGDLIIKADKGKWGAEFSGLPQDKFGLKKQYPIESYGGKETFDYEYSTVVENIRARPIKEVLPLKETKPDLPQGAELYFDISKEPKQTGLFDNFGQVTDSYPTIKQRSLNLFPGEKPGVFAYDKIQLNKNSFRNTVRRLTTDETGSFAPLRESQVIPGGLKSELDFWKRDIILDELQPKFTTTVKSFEIPNTYSSSWGLAGAGLSLLGSSLSMGGLSSQRVNSPVTHGVWAANAPKLTTRPDILEKSDIGLLSGSIFGTWQDSEQDSKQDSKQDTKQIIDVIPDIRLDILTDVLPDFPSGGDSGWIDSLPWEPYPQKSKKTPLPLGGDTLDIFSPSGFWPKIRKTKQKTIKNEYGDPFKIKLKL